MCLYVTQRDPPLIYIDMSIKALCAVSNILNSGPEVLSSIANLIALYSRGFGANLFIFRSPVRLICRSLHVRKQSSFFEMSSEHCGRLVMIH